MAPSSPAFIEAVEAANIPIVKDLNSGNGIGVRQGTGALTSDYRRSSAYDYYRAAANRTNLVVLHDAAVQQITFTKDANGTPVANGVIIIDHIAGLHRTVTAAKEVIVTLGTFQSPQMLMVSVCSSPHPPPVKGC